MTRNFYIKIENSIEYQKLTDFLQKENVEGRFFLGDESPCGIAIYFNSTEKQLLSWNKADEKVFKMWTDFTTKEQTNCVICTSDEFFEFMNEYKGLLRMNNLNLV